MTRTKTEAIEAIKAQDDSWRKASELENSDEGRMTYDAMRHGIFIAQIILTAEMPDPFSVLEKRYSKITSIISKSLLRNVSGIPVDLANRYAKQIVADLLDDHWEIEPKR